MANEVPLDIDEAVVALVQQYRALAKEINSIVFDNAPGDLKTLQERRIHLSADIIRHLDLGLVMCGYLDD